MASDSSHLTQRILSIVFFNFAAYFCVGLPMAVVPGYVHNDLGYSAIVAGLAVSIQYLATLLSRAWAGNLCDVHGPRRSVLTGLALCSLSGVFLFITALTTQAGWVSLGFLLTGRLILGAGESLVTTGTISWGIGVVGPSHTGKVISWNGITTYGALAVGAPLGVAISNYLGFSALGLITIALTAICWWLARRRTAVTPVAGERLPFRKVFGVMTPFGLCLALGSVGFGTLTAFVTLYYASRGWQNAALSLTALGVCFVGSRLLFADAIRRFGGYRVALASFAVEATGLALIWLAQSPEQALAGAAITGFGFALVFPSLGMEAVHRVPASNRGSALGAYSVFLDLALGVTGPLSGWIAGQFGYSEVFLFASACSMVALGASYALSRRKLASVAP
jgi:MFS family permease